MSAAVGSQSFVTNRLPYTPNREAQKHMRMRNDDPSPSSWCVSSGYFKGKISI
jgi:hypothetical protein